MEERTSVALIFFARIHARLLRGLSRTNAISGRVASSPLWDELRLAPARGPGMPNRQTASMTRR